MTQAERQKIVERIEKLLAVTTAAGAAEAEAMKAAAMATDLMDKHGITFAEVRKLKGGGFAWRSMTPKQRWLTEFYSWIGGAVAAYTGTVSTSKTEYVRDRPTRKVYAVGFAGEDSDVAFAEWLIQAVGDFVHAGYRQELKRANAQQPSDNPHRWEKRKLTGKALAKFRSGYLVGAAYSITQRLNRMADERAASQIVTGNALTIVSKAKLALYKLREQGVGEGNDRAHIEYDHGSVAAGKARGDQAQFNKPVGHQGSDVLMIEKR